MGIGRFFKSLVDSEVMGDEIVLKVQEIYKKTQEISPHDDPHETLAKTWLSRMRARGIDIDQEGIALNAMTSSYIFACLRPGANVRALALHILFEERPDIIEQYPKFSQEYNDLLSPIHQALEDGSAETLYRKYNPNIPA